MARSHPLLLKDFFLMGSLKKVFESFYHFLFLGHSANLGPVCSTGALSSLYAHGLHKHFLFCFFPLQNLWFFRQNILGVFIFPIVNSTNFSIFLENFVKFSISQN